MSNAAATPQRVECMPWWKRLELWGRRFLVVLLGGVIGKTPRQIELPEKPRFLLVRLDERVGNLVMLTPVLRTLRARFPDATIDVLGNARGRAILGSHPDLDGFLCFRKRALFALDGPLRIPRELRRRRYSVAIDASNPTDPSLTQAILVALSGARYTIGSAARGYGSFYSQRIEASAEHEIDLRLQLLAPLPGDAVVREPSLRPVGASLRFVEAFQSESDTGAYVVLNLGARLEQKQLSVDEYAKIADAMSVRGTVVLTWGPKERAIAEAVSARSPGAIVAPPTTLEELCAVLEHASAVVSCDTGPMHVAVALGTPTLGVFVATDPARFGYSASPHGVVDAREERRGLVARVERWLAERVGG